MYLIDANVLINAKNTYYPFGLVPGFWSWVEQQAREGRLYSIVQVRQLRDRRADDPANWSPRATPQHTKTWRAPSRNESCRV